MATGVPLSCQEVSDRTNPPSRGDTEQEQLGGVGPRAHQMGRLERGGITKWIIYMIYPKWLVDLV